MIDCELSLLDCITTFTVFPHISEDLGFNLTLTLWKVFGVKLAETGISVLQPQHMARSLILINCNEYFQLSAHLLTKQ